MYAMKEIAWIIYFYVPSCLLLPSLRSGQTKTCDVEASLHYWYGYNASRRGNLIKEYDLE